MSAKTVRIGASRVDLNLAPLEMLSADIKANARARVHVGVLRDHNARTDGSDAGNATIGLVHEFGSPTKNIPERSWLRMPLIVALPKVIEEAGPGFWKRLVLERGVLVGLKALGIAAEDAIQQAFETGGFGRWPAWSVRYGRRRERGLRQILGLEDFIGPIHPGSLLIETGELRQSVTSRVVK